VKYFQIGNETWAFSREVSEDRYLTSLAAYLEAVRSVDPGLQIIVDGQPASLAARVHRELGDRIAYFAVHHYQPWRIREVRRGDEHVDAASLSARDIWYAWVTVPQMDSAGQSVLSRNEFDQARTLGYPVAMTEWNWNGWWDHPLSGRVALSSLFAKGVGAAGILHAIIRQGDVVEMAAQSMLIGDGWGIHAIHCDRRGRTPPYMIPSGQVTMLYSQHHGSRCLAIDLAGMPYYEQPYRMAGIGPARRAAYLDVLATRGDQTLFVHAINRHFEEAIGLRVDLSALEGQPANEGTLYVLEGRLNDAPSAGEPLPPAQIRRQPFDVPGSRFAVELPARSVSVVEVPLR
jgi:alpha-L-arabinofuranosidase